MMKFFVGSDQSRDHGSGGGSPKTKHNFDHCNKGFHAVLKDGNHSFVHQFQHQIVVKVVVEEESSPKIAMSVRRLAT